MIALKIDDLKDFTRKLFIGENFDSFLVREAEIVTFNSFSIDGRVRQGYYSKEELTEEKKEYYSSWQILRPFCFSLIKGSKLPESFLIVFQLAPDLVESFLYKERIAFTPEQVNGLYVNVKYEEQNLICITGTSVSQFTLDKTLDREWDETVKRFFKKNDIVFEQV